MIFLVDTLNNVKPLRAMAKEAAFRNLLEAKTESLKKSLRRQVVSEEALKNGNEILAAIFLGAGFFLAVSVWQVPIIELAVVGVLLKKTTNGIAKIQESFQRAMMVESAYLEAQELITETAAAPEQDPGNRPAAFARECRLEGVSFAHGGHQVLHAVSLRIPATGVTVLTGPSGAGKTTIADLVLGLYQPDEAGSSSTTCPWSRSISGAGATWWATCPRSWCCSTTACSPTSAWATARSARPTCAAPSSSPGRGTSSTICRRG